LPIDRDKVRVRGITMDNGVVKKVIVNGREARPTATNFSAWEITCAGSIEARIAAHAEDAAGNVERLAHIWANK
jgi:hypothetical protein